jgi:AcrR family transcriptional regulator
VAELCDAALDLFLEDGIMGVPVERIASAAGTSKGNFYRYFKDKEELVATVLGPLADGVQAALAECEDALRSARDQTELMAAYQGVGLALGGLLFAHERVVLLYLQEARAPGVGPRRPIRALADSLGRRSIEMTIAARERDLLREFDPRVSALAVVGAVERLLFAALSGEHEFDPLAVGEALIAIVMDGMRPRSPAG